MLSDGEAGIDCGNCGHKEIASTNAEKEVMKERVVWQQGDPVCPGCNNSVWFEDYLDD